VALEIGGDPRPPRACGDHRLCARPVGDLVLAHGLAQFLDRLLALAGELQHRAQPGREFRVVGAVNGAPPR
jgi:hypothetical protein